MPVPGGTTREVLERLLAPLQEAVALAVAGCIRARRSLPKAFGVPNSSTMTEWSMTRSTGTSGLIFCGIAAERLHGVAHGREVDDGGNAGEVLHQHARRAEGDFLAGLALVVQPGGDGFDVRLGDRAAVLGAQQVLQQHLHREGKRRNAGKAVLLGFNEAVIDVGLVPDLQRLPGLETVDRHVAMIPSKSGGRHRAQGGRSQLTQKARRPIARVIEGFQSTRYMAATRYGPFADHPFVA
jgi:hypothetical protein